MPKKYTSLANPSLIFQNFLYLSSKTAATSLPTLKEYGITHIISITTDVAPLFAKNENIKYLLITDLLDEPTEKQASILATHIDTVNAFIHQIFLENLQNKFTRRTSENLPTTDNKILIHCKAGISRSVSFLCCYLMTVTGKNFEQVLNFVKQQRFTACPNPKFQEFLNQKFDVEAARQKFGISEYLELTTEISSDKTEEE